MGNTDDKIGKTIKKLFVKREKVDQEIKLQFGDLVKVVNKDNPEEHVKMTVDMDGRLQVRSNNPIKQQLERSPQSNQK